MALEDKKSKIITVYSPLSGVGTTTLTIDTAIIYAKDANNKVCVIDFDVTNPSIISTLNLEVKSETTLEKNILNYKKDNIFFDVLDLSNFFYKNNIEEKDICIDEVLEKLRNYYNIIIIDTSPVYSYKPLSHLLQVSSELNFLIEQDMVVLSHTKNFLENLEFLKIRPQNIKFIINKYKESKAEIFSVEKISKVLNIQIKEVIPYKEQYKRRILKFFSK